LWCVSVYALMCRWLRFCYKDTVLFEALFLCLAWPSPATELCYHAPDPPHTCWQFLCFLKFARRQTKSLIHPRIHTYTHQTLLVLATSPEVHFACRHTTSVIHTHIHAHTHTRLSLFIATSFRQMLLAVGAPRLWDAAAPYTYAPWCLTSGGFKRLNRGMRDTKPL
jgi:hypothetical protein